MVECASQQGIFFKLKEKVITLLSILYLFFASIFDSSLMDKRYSGQQRSTGNVTRKPPGFGPNAKTLRMGGG